MSPHRGAAPAARVGAIWAQTAQGVIGENGTMPWHVPEDLAHFKRVTAGHPVIMGRRTWQSFPEKFRPLPGRSNIVLTSSTQRHAELRAAGARPVGSLQEALELAATCPGGEQIWIIGGGNVYTQAMDLIDTAIVTRLDLNAAGDTRAPSLPGNFNLTTVDPASGWHTSTSQVPYRFETWHKTKDNA